MREFQLLLHCARSQPNAGFIRGAVTEGIDWRTLLELARRHRVQPLLIRSLKSACWDVVPRKSQVELESSYRDTVAQNLFLTGELLQLLDILGKQGIATAALKGPVLAEALYGDLSLREFVDLDFFVHEADICKAEQALIARGYKSYSPDEDYRFAFLSYYGQQPFRGQTGIIVDLHWRLANKSVALPVRSAAVWERLQNVTIAGRTVPTLAQEDLVLFLAAHGTMHGWGSLIWVCDFAEFLHKNQGIAWSTIFDQAQQAHSSRPLLLAIFLASTLLDAPAPAELLAKARDNSAVRALAEKVKFGMLHPASQRVLEEFLQGLNTHDLLRHRLWPVATLLMTRTVNDYSAMPLPKALWGLYYLTRPFRLAGRAAHMLRARSK